MLLAVIFPDTTRFELIDVDPMTCRALCGAEVPMPTKPFDDTRSLSVPPVLKARLLVAG